jgi:hypothetical protein
MVLPIAGARSLPPHLPDKQGVGARRLRKNAQGGGNVAAGAPAAAETGRNSSAAGGMNVATLESVTGKLWVAAVLCATMRTSDPLAIVAPTVAVSAADRVRLDRGELVSRVLPAHQGQVAVFAATRISVDSEALIAAATDIADLRKSSFVTAIQRFSDPPQLADLDGLTLDQHHRDVLAACEVGRCSFKLAAIEIEAIKRGRYGDVSGERITAALRSVMLERVRAYRAAGLAALPPIANRARPWYLHDVLAAAQAESPRLLRDGPLSSWIRDGSAVDAIDSFFYWSKEQFGTGKPVILITHVALYRPAAGAAVVVGKQIFGSRYTNGALSMTAITTAPSGDRYLVYLNRTRVDLLGGWYGGLRRSMLESRLAGGVPELIGRLCGRLERRHHVSRPDSLRHH